MTELVLQAVAFEYPGSVRALDGIDLHIGAGDSVAIVGANGSGKTTLIRHLDGLLRPTSGRVLVDGRDAAERTVAQLARQVGLCFQDPDRQIFARSVRDEVDFGLRQLGIDERERMDRITGALERVGLGADLDRHPGDLDDAERKLLTIASVLAMDPPVVVLDEPTVGLDAHGIELVGERIGELHGEGRTVIAISHDMRFVAETFDRVIVLADGRISLDGPAAQVFAAKSWPSLRASGLEPPAAAVEGERRGLGSTPTEASLLAAVRPGAQLG